MLRPLRKLHVHRQIQPIETSTCRQQTGISSHCVSCTDEQAPSFQSVPKGTLKLCCWGLGKPTNPGHPSRHWFTENVHACEGGKQTQLGGKSASSSPLEGSSEPPYLSGTPGSRPQQTPSSNPMDDVSRDPWRQPWPFTPSGRCLLRKTSFLGLASIPY